MSSTGLKSTENLPLSNPVAPTTFCEDLRETPKQNLSLNLTVLRALAEVGRQLQIVASALGEGSFAPENVPALNSTPAPAPPPASDLTVAQLTREFLFAKARAGRSDRYLRALKNSLGKFVQFKGRANIAAVTVHDVESWLHSSGWKARTARGYLGDVRTMFNFAVRRGYLDKNPAAGVELPVVEPCRVIIHTPEEVRTVLNFARSYDLHICRALAVRYFAGLRSAECDRVTEADISTKHVTVTAESAKTRRRRLVAISPNLREWLALGGKLPVVGSKSNVWRDFTAALAKSTGVAWSHNVTRHSFCSYHLARHKSAGKTALEAGHTEQMLFAHYRELVTPEAAAEFWAILPG